MEPPPMTRFDIEHVSAGYRLCGHYTEEIKFGRPAEIKCEPGAAGRYVYVYHTDEYHLSMCEVQVFGLGELSVYRYMKEIQ